MIWTLFGQYRLQLHIFMVSYQVSHYVTHTLMADTGN